MTRKPLGLLAAAACAFGAVYPISASAEIARSRFQIRGVVRTICEVEVSDPLPLINQGTVEFGTMTQLCNNREGYRIIMHHPAGLEQARFEIGGVSVPLSSGTETVIVDSNGPAFRTSQARLQLSGTTSELDTLFFRIEPRGAIY